MCRPKSVTNRPGGHRHQLIHVILFVTVFSAPRLGTQPAHNATPPPGGGTSTSSQPQPQVHLGLLEAGRGPAAGSSSSCWQDSSRQLQLQPPLVSACCTQPHATQDNRNTASIQCETTDLCSSLKATSYLDATLDQEGQCSYMHRAFTPQSRLGGVYNYGVKICMLPLTY
jgi:hypothetical protein